MSSLPPAKRQKIDSAVDVFDKSTLSDPANILTIRDLSFQTPLRKKLNVIFTQSHLQAHSVAKQELAVTFNKINHVICVAAPDKTAKTWNFVIIYQDNDINEAIVFGVPDTIAKTAVASTTYTLDPITSYKSVLITAFKKIYNIIVVEPSAEEFASPIPLPGRPKEPAFHAVSHRGAKEGFLYFLATGILYGFKKPVLFFPLDMIREVTFTNILQRTFNLVVCTEENVEGEEFGMIDQALFAGIQGYTVKHGIQDASLSEERKARRAGRQVEEESGELERAMEEYEAGYSDDKDFKEFDKAEAEWEEGEIPKVKKVKKEGTTKDLLGKPHDMANGVGDVDTSDDEDFDATFAGGDSDGGSPSGSSDEDSDSSDESSDEDEDEDEDEDDGDEDEDEDE
jgi:hypothetical protein